jgi:cell division protein FtsQ
MGVTAPADRRFRRSHAKPSRRRAGISFWRWRALFAAVLIVISWYAAKRLVAGASAFALLRVEQINVHGNTRLSDAEVLTLLQGLRGRSTLSIDLEEWRHALVVSPWVADAILRRTLPSTIDVTIFERSPIGLGRISGALYLIDQRGAVIDKYGPDYQDLDLPIVDGLSAQPGSDSTNSNRAQLVSRLLDSLRAGNLAGRISQIDVSDSRNAVVLLDGDTALIRLGNERFAERLQSYLELAPAIRDRVPAIDYVDLRFGERVFVRPAGGQARTPKRQPGDGTREKGL